MILTITRIPYHTIPYHTIPQAAEYYQRAYDASSDTIDQEMLEACQFLAAHHKVDHDDDIVDDGMAILTRAYYINAKSNLLY